MSQTATYVQPSPWPLQLLLWIAAFALAFCIHATTAHAGPQLRENRSWQPSIKRIRKETRITVIRPQRVQGRALAGFPMRQAVANTTLAGACVAGTAYRVSAWIPTPGGILANILIRPFR